MAHRTYKSGLRRDQASLLPARLEDYVSRDNPVRAIEAYVASLDVIGLGFRDVGSDGGSGQPPYDPSLLLKLYLYGYLNQVRSSRRLEREARRNVELMWLLRGLTPGYRTIANFRKDNGAALRAANRGFVRLADELDLLGGEVVALDGAFFHGDASKASIVTETRLSERLLRLDGSIEEYSAALATNDAAEAAAAAAGTRSPAQHPDGEAIAGKLAALREKREATAAELTALAQSGETQLSRTDPDARLLAKHGQIVAGYNVQIAVDAKHKLIVASAVVNDGNDSGQLHSMATAACEALGVETIHALADSGYYNAEALKACEDDAITAFVPEPARGQRAQAEGRFGRDAFRYDGKTDVYRCPAGQELRRLAKLKRQASGRLTIRYASRPSMCGACPLRRRCIAANSRRREIERWEHEAVVERHRARMQADGGAMMSRRKALAEHPFGTLKCRAGYRHFLLRGFAKVRGEWSLMALCYNFSRVLNILGIDGWCDHLARRAAITLGVLFAIMMAALQRLHQPADVTRRIERQARHSGLCSPHSRPMPRFPSLAAYG